MFRSLTASAICVSGSLFVAPGVFAADTTVLTFQVSLDGVAWVPSVVLDSGVRTVQVRATASFAPDVASRPLGLANLNFQPTISNWSPLHDSLMGFASVGTNQTGGGVRDLPGMNAPLGRIMPFANTGPTASDPYHGHEQMMGGMRHLRLARTSTSNWPGDGPATNASNNSNGSGGIAISQKSWANVAANDPLFVGQIQDVVLFKFALVIDTAAGGGSGGGRVLDIDAPLESIGRDWQTGVRVARWFSNVTDNVGQTRTHVQVQAAEIVVVPASPGLAIVAGGLMAWGMRGTRRRA